MPLPMLPQHKANKAHTYFHGDRIVPTDNSSAGFIKAQVHSRIPSGCTCALFVSFPKYHTVRVSAVKKNRIIPTDSCKFTEKNYLYSIVLTLYIRLHHVRPAFLHHHFPATLLLLGLLTSCRHPNKSSDIQAHETLVHVQALLQSDSFPDNDSLLTPSIRFFTQHGPDSLMAQAYYLQGEILRHHHFMLRASDAYIKSLELCPDSSQLRFRIHLAQAKTCRIEKIASEAAPI